MIYINLTRDYYDRDKVVGLGQFRHIFPEPHFRQLLINPPSQLLGFPKGMGPCNFIVVVYSPEKTIRTLVGVSSALFSSNLKKITFPAQFWPIIHNGLLSKMIQNRPINHF